MIGVEASSLTSSGPLTGIGRTIMRLSQALASQRPGQVVLWTDPGRRVPAALLAGTGLRTRHYGPLGPPAMPMIYPHERLWPRTRAVGVGIIYDLYSIYGINAVSPSEQLEGLVNYRAMADTMDGLVYISRFTRDEFLRYLAYPAERCCVAPLSADDAFRPRPEGVAAARARVGLGTRPYFLFTGLHHPNKNLVRLIEAFARSGLSQSHDLVISGPPMSERPEAFRIRQAIERHALQDRVHAPGYVEFDTLIALYGGASAYLFPSLCEGFGLPILEAMRCGTPVLTSDRTACPEVAGGHAVLVDPYSVEAIAAGMHRAIAIDAPARAAAQAYAESLSWRETARLVADFIDGLTVRAPAAGQPAR